MRQAVPVLAPRGAARAEPAPSAGVPRSPLRAARPGLAVEQAHELQQPARAIVRDRAADRRGGSRRRAGRRPRRTPRPPGRGCCRSPGSCASIARGKPSAGCASTVRWPGSSRASRRITRCRPCPRSSSRAVTGAGLASMAARTPSASRPGSSAITWVVPSTSRYRSGSPSASARGSASAALATSAWLSSRSSGANRDCSAWTDSIGTGRFSSRSLRPRIVQLRGGGEAAPHQPVDQRRRQQRPRPLGDEAREAGHVHPVGMDQDRRRRPSRS